MELIITYEDEAYHSQAPQAWVEEKIIRIFEALSVTEVSMGVRFVSDETIQDLNATYRGLDEPTDILSFGSDDDEMWIPEQEEQHLGDLAISLDTLKRNAQSFSVEVQEELLRLLIHGIMHLLGSDHHSNDEEEPMLVAQEALLHQFGESER